MVYIFATLYMVMISDYSSAAGDWRHLRPFFVHKIRYGGAMARISIKQERLLALEEDLKTFAKKAVPYAVRQAINSTAFAVQGEAKENVRENMINRNKYTERMYLVDQAKSLDIDRIQAVVGHTADYMEEQEYGGMRMKDGSYKTVVPTPWAAGQEGAAIHTKLPRGQKKLKNIVLKKRKKPRYRSKRTEATARAFQAVNNGDKYVFLDGANWGRSKPAIYRIWGRNKVRGRNRYKSFKLRAAYRLSDDPSSISRLSTLGPAAKHAEDLMPDFYIDALKYQLRHHGVQLTLF